MDYLCLDMPSKFFSNDFLPEYYIENDVKPNMSLLPFYDSVKVEENNNFMEYLIEKNNDLKNIINKFLNNNCINTNKFNILKDT